MRGKTKTAALLALLCLGAFVTKAHERCKPVETRAPQVVTVTVQHTDASCNGSNDGTATAIAVGTAPYTYYWSNGRTEQTIIHLSAGNYGVTVMDADGSMDSASVTIEQPSGMAVYSICMNTCPGQCDGASDLVITGGEAPYTFAWSGPGGFTSPDEDLTGLCTGVYWTTITDANGCQKIKGTWIQEIAGPWCEPDTACDLSVNTAVTNDTNCNDSLCNGLVELSVSGGAAPYDIVWSNLQVGNVVDELCAGNYGFTVTDVNGCTANGLVEVGCNVVVPCDISVAVQTTSYPCIATACLGSAVAVVTGGDAPYQYAWSNGASTGDIGSLCVGGYAVTVTDANGCTAIGEGQVECVIDTCFGFNATAMSSNDTDCADSLCNGAIALGIDGGTAPYDVLWSSGAAGGELSGLCPDVYSYTVTDANGCTINGLVEVGCDSIVTPPCLMIVSNNTVPDVGCGDEICTGSVYAVVNAGTPPYTYAWSNGATGVSIGGLCTGVYSYTVTDAAGCVASDTTEVTCIAAPPCTIPIDVTVTNDQNCNDEFCNGLVELSFSSPNIPFVFTWSNGGDANLISGVCAGIYTLTVTDVLGCLYLDTIEVGCDSVVECGTITAMEIVTNDSDCNDSLCNGSVQLTDIVGGTAPYSVVWGSGASGLTNENLCGGFYTYIITDANGCTSGNNAFVDCQLVVDSCFGFAVTVENIADSDCADDTCDGMIFSMVTGGVGPFTYLWNNGATTEMIGGLCVGEYNVVVTDALGCTVTAAADISCVSACTMYVTTSIKHDSICSDGVCDGYIINDVINGTAPYSFVWNNGSTEEDLVNICAGPYSFTVTDAQGCTYSSEYMVLECNNPLPCTMTVTAATTPDANCDDSLCNGAAYVSALDFWAMPTYLWSNGATDANLQNLCAGVYGYTVSDGVCTFVDSVTITCTPSECAGFTVYANAAPDTNCWDPFCNGWATLYYNNGVAPYNIVWSNGDTGLVANGLCQGLYTVTVTDALGCTTTGIADVYCLEPTCFLGIESHFEYDALCDDSLCQGGIIVTNVTNATGPLSYYWSDGSTNSSLLNICAGFYSVTVIDSLGCTSYMDMSIGCTGVPFCQLAALTSGSPDQVCGDSICDGYLLITDIGGRGPVSYLWSTGETTQQITGLCEGLYYFTVTDSAGCVFSDTAEMWCLPPCITFHTDEFTTPANCGVTCNGSAWLEPWGAFEPFTYLWSNGETTAQITALCAGTYGYTITSADGCTLSDTLTVGCQAPCALVISGTVTNDGLCDDGVCDGSIVTTVTGGTEPYTYEWNVGGSGPELLNQCQGIFVMTVTDANGCTAESEFFEIACTIGPDSCTLQVNSSYQNDSNCSDGVCDGSAELSLVGAVLPASYVWSNGATTASQGDLCAGLYFYTVTDAAGCTVVGSVDIGCETPDPCFGFTAFVSTTPATNCIAGCDGQAFSGFSGANGAVTASWNTGDTATMVFGLCPGIYTVTLTDENGCTASEFGEVTCAAPCTTEITLETSGALCPGSSVQVFISGDGGPIPTYTDYLWSNGSTDAFIEVADSGLYCVTVHTVNGGCEGTACILVEPVAFEALILTLDESCAGTCNGTAEAVVTSGTEPFDYTWDNGGFGPAIQDLCPGVYCVTITDGNQCTLDACALIAGTDPLDVTVETQNSNDCNDGICSGSATAMATGGTPPYGYLWSSGEDTESIDSACAGFNQTLLVFDANGCFVETTYDIFCLGILGFNGESDGGDNMPDIQNPASITVSPNPFNESTSITFSVSEEQRVVLGLYDVTGRLITTLYNDIAKANQTNVVTFTGAAGNGLFVYRLMTANETLTGNIVQMK